MTKSSAEDRLARRLESIEALMNALTIGGIAIACAVIVAFAGIGGLPS